jgi:hypothetical protein
LTWTVMKVKTTTTITCPLCGTQAREVMPENACQHFYVCTGCGELLKSKPGQCCVFCSYADTVCPPKQQSRDAQAGDAPASLC